MTISTRNNNETLSGEASQLWLLYLAHVHDDDVLVAEASLTQLCEVASSRSLPSSLSPFSLSTAGNLIITVVIRLTVAFR